MTGEALPQEPDADVVIIGAGPVGLALANLLAVYGVDAIVLERNDDILDYPRAVGMDDESMRTFQAMKLADRILPHTMPNMLNRFFNGRGKLLAEIAPQGRPYGWPRKFGFLQSDIDRELLNGLERFPGVDVRFRTTVTSWDQDAHGVDVHVEGEDGTSRIRARYLVGCDGGRSDTRHALGTVFAGVTSSTRWLVMDVRNDPIGIPNVYMVADSRRPYASIGLPKAIRRFEIMLFPKEGEEEAQSDEFVTKVLTGIVPDPQGIEVIRRRVYTHHSRIAESFRQGRVFIAGDAAHLMPVWQGQGFNSGIRDAMNLAWKLASVVKGVSPTSLLDTYQQERRPHALAMAKLSVTAGRVIAPGNIFSAGFRDLIFATLKLFPKAKRYITEFRFKPMPRYREGVVLAGGAVDETSPIGRLMIQPRVDLGTGDAPLLDEVLGDWFAVLVWGNDPRQLLNQESLEFFDRLGVQLISIRPGGWTAEADDRQVPVIRDTDGEFKRLVEQTERSVFFIRPDRIVAAACLTGEINATARELQRVLAPTKETAGA